jgi:hypothetical protein
MSTATETTKERPILFCATMREAIERRRKTKTRRVIPNNARGADRVLWTERGQLVPPRASDQAYTGWVSQVDALNGLHLPLTCRYGVPGDRLYVVEPWRYEASGEIVGVRFKSDDKFFVSPNYDEEARILAKLNGRHYSRWAAQAIPKWAARTWLEIESVRAERLQDISEEDARAEGAPFSLEPATCVGRFDIRGQASHRQGFIDLWEKLNATRGFPWSSNPWVWAITFRLTEDRR